MAQDLLAALGARIEAQLNAKDARSRTIEDAVKARVSANPPAPFTLLPDGTKQFGYAPSVDEIISDVSDSTSEAANDFGFGDRSVEIAPSAEDISAAIAPFAALLAGSAQILSQPAIPVNASTETSGTSGDVPESAAVNVPVSVQVSEPDTAPVDVSLSILVTEAATTPATPPAALPVTTTTGPTAPTVPSTAAASVPNTATSVAASTSATAPTSIADTAAAPFVMLADGTKQFGYAPTGGVVNRVPNITPEVPTEFGIGATVRRKGVWSDAPMTVTAAEGGIIRATVTNSTGTHIFEFPYNQFDLITAAP